MSMESDLIMQTRYSSLKARYDTGLWSKIVIEHVSSLCSTL